MPHTRTGLFRPNLRIGMSFSEHLAHRMRLQWRQWCFLGLMPNLFPHSRQMSPSVHGGSFGRKSRSRTSSCLVATW
uniref:Putative membrane trafficking and cell signaling protein hrs n=1 Tax=Ixodes ricinus TaxID=34613 RepID=A0A0K8R6V5_IXORI